PLHATHCLSSLVLASILLPLPLHTGHVRVSGFLGLGNFRVGIFFRNLEVSWLGYQLMKFVFSRIFLRCTFSSFVVRFITNTFFLVHSLTPLANVYIQLRLDFVTSLKSFDFSDYQCACFDKFSYSVIRSRLKARSEERRVG